MRIEVVTGTDTDVGKTWGTAALTARALAAGLRDTRPSQSLSRESAAS